MNEIEQFLHAVEDAERGPTEHDLTDAPTLNPWQILLENDQTILRLYGRAKGHPTIDDDFLTTSPLLAFDPKEGWARTRSRWYKIGPDWEGAKSSEHDEMADQINKVLKLTIKQALNYYRNNVQH